MLDRFFRIQGDACGFPSETYQCPSQPATEARCDLAGLGVGRGFIQSHLSSDAVVNVMDGELTEPLSISGQVKCDLLLVRATLSSDCTYAPEGATPWHFRRPGVTVIALPRDTPIDIQVEANVAQRTVTVTQELSALSHSHLLEPADIPHPLRTMLGTPLRTPQVLLTMPVQADIAGLLEDLTRSRLSGALRRMQVQARASEFIALVFASWNERLENECAADCRRHRDVELLVAARRILFNRFASPPTLHELAHQLGTNKNKLSQLFQENLGVTPQVYCLQRRIERAQALLAEGRLNVGQIADAVGYQHQSSFTGAFREAVGESPRQFARRYRAEFEEVLAVAH